MLANRPKQLNFKSRLYTPIERMLVLDQIRYHKPINIVRQYFDFCMQLRVQGEIRIIPNYPTGWIAEVPSEDKIWTVECYRGELRLIKVADLVGHTQNGHYIVSAEEDLSGNIYYESCHQNCEYLGLEDGGPYCIDFCDDGDYEEFQCRCCPWVIMN